MAMFGCNDSDQNNSDSEYDTNMGLSGFKSEFSKLSDMPVFSKEVIERVHNNIPRTVQLKGKTVEHNEDGSSTVFYDNGDVVEWGKPNTTDLENLKDVFDAIGVNYYHEQNENKVCLYVNNGCFDCCGVVFNFKDYKFIDATPRT
jgi:hypothetical protein